ncbi:MAG: alkane 1-monooxygenase [bacterium]|nr:alkane 1-monooxygenase [bacterium]
MRWLPYGFGYVYALVTAAAVAWRGPWLLAPAVLSFVLLPALDAAVGILRWNPSPDAEAALQRHPIFAALTWLWVPIGVGMTIVAIAAACGPSWTWPERLALAFGLGLMNSVVGIVYAHELVHRAHRFEQWLGETLLALVTYTHFRVEHVFGHHRFVGTSRDPATARLGENFYAFCARSVVGQVVSAWHLEAERLARAGEGTWTPRNRMLGYACATLAIYAAIWLAFGAVGALLFAFQSAVAIVSLEITNYLEHYGLQRAARDDGSYERVQPRHSWNSAHRVTNWFLINLGRHSDHHAVASRRWQILRTYDAREAPQLPSGYAAMYLLALVPPLWFAVMNPRVAALRSD